MQQLWSFLVGDTAYWFHSEWCLKLYCEKWFTFILPFAIPISQKYVSNSCFTLDIQTAKWCNLSVTPSKYPWWIVTLLKISPNGRFSITDKGFWLKTRPNCLQLAISLIFVEFFYSSKVCFPLRKRCHVNSKEKKIGSTKIFELWGFLYYSANGFDDPNMHMIFSWL